MDFYFLDIKDKIGFQTKKISNKNGFLNMKVTFEVILNKIKYLLDVEELAFFIIKQRGKSDLKRLFLNTRKLEYQLLIPDFRKQYNLWKIIALIYKQLFSTKNSVLKFDLNDL